MYRYLHFCEFIRYYNNYMIMIILVGAVSSGDFATVPLLNVIFFYGLILCLCLILHFLNCVPKNQFHVTSISTPSGVLFQALTIRSTTRRADHVCRGYTSMDLRHRTRRRCASLSMLSNWHRRTAASTTIWNSQALKVLRDWWDTVEMVLQAGIMRMTQGQTSLLGTFAVCRTLWSDF